MSYSLELKRSRSDDGDGDADYEDAEYMDDEDEGMGSGGAPSMKRQRPSPSQPPQLEDEEDDEGQAPSDYKPAIDLSIGGDEAWKRPKLRDVNPHTDRITFQLIDTDYWVVDPVRIGSSMAQFSQKQAALRLFGVNEHGNSVCCQVHNFMSYFYVQAPGEMTNDMVNMFGQTLNAALKDSGSSATKQVNVYVLRVERVKRQSIWGYHFNELSDFLQVTVALPSFVATARRICERGLNIPQVGFKCFQVYECNLPYALRYMVDKNLRGGGWVELPANTYRVRPWAEQKKMTHCQLEVDIDYTHVIGHDPNGEWLKMAPMRILSFDIECAGRKGHFPKPEIDPVIQIANIVSLQASPGTPIIKNVMTLRGCAPIAGAQVITNETERELLMNWIRFFVQADADIITGYNIVNFDLPYLLDRARALKLADFPYLGRVIGSLTTMKNSKFESKGLGIRESKEIKIEGRVQFDLIDVIRREYKLRSYTLNAVSAHFLGQQKEDVQASIISDLQNGTDENRRRLAVYCIKDAFLPLLLVEKLMCIINYVEMARVTGVPISYLLTRGQQIKVVSQLYRKARQHGLVIPTQRIHATDEKYEGATVIEPVKGYYALPIATLDFSSLYPSIMMAHNLCYTTLIGPAHVSRLSPDDYTRTPTGDFFVKSHKRKGLLPEILTELLEARSRAKKEMKHAKDPFEAAVLNGRQLALKISANSVYGFTGAQVGQLPCLQISSSVTGFGRNMILQTKEEVEREYTIANGYKYDAQVIYGDTDSVMVKFGEYSVAESMELGAKAAVKVSQKFINPIRLEFEKVYFPYLLMNKKRYAGLYWTNPNKWDKMDTKGIETVRRDNCALVSNVVTECLNYILIEKSVDMAISYCQSMISDLMMNRLDLSLLVISKSLGKSANSDDYASKQAHVELAERMRKRDPRSAPVVGDRVAYVITKAGKDAKAYEKAEDPIYVLEHDIPIDTTYYLQNQLQQPLTRIFEPIMGEGKVQKLFSGEHTRRIKVSTPSVGGIMQFAIKKRTCIGCKSQLSPDQHIVCSHCAPKQAELYMKQVEKVREHELLFTKVWTQCQRCQGSLHQDVLCTSKDCPIFYRRKKVQKDLNETQKALDRFTF